MTEIEHRVEVPGHVEPDYAAETYSQHELAQGKHRTRVGGAWDEIGRLQLDFLLAQGLRPGDRLLDVGCGCFRAGRHLIDFLEPGHYYGFDINPELLRVGYDHELTEEQRGRLPVGNLRATDRFDSDFGVSFDVAIAQSVFTHMPLNSIRLCLARVAAVMKPGGRFFATFFEAPANFPLDGTWRKRYSERNHYWLYRDDLAWAARFSPWEVRYLGDWGHPRDQVMMEFTRLGEPGHRP